MMPMKHAAVDGQRSAPMAASSAISSYIKATIQASPVNANDLFNSLLVLWRVSRPIRSRSKPPGFMRDCPRPPKPLVLPIWNV
jgi:hypothetical protein